MKLVANHIHFQVLCQFQGGYQLDEALKDSCSVLGFKSFCAKFSPGNAKKTKGAAWFTVMLSGFTDKKQSKRQALPVKLGLTSMSWNKLYEFFEVGGWLLWQGRSCGLLLHQPEILSESGGHTVLGSSVLSIQTSNAHGCVFWTRDSLPWWFRLGVLK